MKLHSPAMETTIEVHRVLGAYSQDREGPHLLVITGMHGNEPSGIFGLARVLRTLNQLRPPIRGTLTGLAANLSALELGVRYVDEDLNRISTPDLLQRLERGLPVESVEEKELAGLLEAIDHALAAHPGEVFFLDCHTTSAESQPYLSVNRVEESIAFTRHFPLYSVVGMEQVLRGLLSKHLNARGCHGAAVEAGQHDDLASVENQEACIWLALVHSGCIAPEDLPPYGHARDLLARTVLEGQRTFHLAYHYRIHPGEQFVMTPGYVNFQKIAKGEPLARNREGPIVAPCAGRILMPLYQAKGEDGFFVVREDQEALDGLRG